MLRSLAERAAHQARIPALKAEVESAFRVLNTPAARLIARRGALLLLEDVEALQTSKALVVDACRHVVRDASTVVSPARRPVLFALARALAETYLADVPLPRARSSSGPSAENTPTNAPRAAAR